jgi:hypothetical protein
LHHQDSLESSESTAKLRVNTLIKIIYNMHIHLVAKHDSMCCAGRHACHAAVLKRTAPVLVLVLDFQILKKNLLSIFLKISRTHRLAPQRQVLLPGCQVNTADNQIVVPSYRLCQRCSSACSGGALAFWSERGPSACQSRWTLGQVWLASSHVSSYMYRARNAAWIAPF